MPRLVLAAVVFATGPLVAACDSLDTFELFDTKKKLVGERKEVFPDGVPGVTSGIPAELVKGYREPEHAEVTDPAKVAAEAAATTGSTKPKPKPATQPKPAVTAAATSPAQRTAAKPQPAQSSAATTTTAAAAQAAPPPAAAPPAGQPSATAAPWPTTQPVAAWPGTPGSGTLAR